MEFLCDDAKDKLPTLALNCTEFCALLCFSQPLHITIRQPNKTAFRFSSVLLACKTV